MNLDPLHDLSLGAVELLDGFLLSEPENVPVTDEELTDLLLGNLSDREKERVSHRLTLSVAGRRRLLDIGGELALLEVTPFGSWSARNREGAFLKTARTALTNLTLVTARDWDQIVRSPEPVFAQIRAFFMSAANEARLALSSPRFAEERGEIGAGHLFASVTPAGDLEAFAAPLLEGNITKGHRAVLEVADPLGGGFPVAESKFEEGRWIFRAAGFGNMAGFPEGPLPNGLFRVKVEGQSPSPESPGALSVDCGDGRTILVPLLRPAEIVNGELALFLSIPREEFLGKRLIVSVPNGRREVVLGQWNVAEIAQGQPLRVEVFGLADGPLPFGSLLKGRLVDTRSE